VTEIHSRRIGSIKLYAIIAIVLIAAIGVFAAYMFMKSTSSEKPTTTITQPSGTASTITSISTSTKTTTTVKTTTRTETVTQVVTSTSQNTPPTTTTTASFTSGRIEFKLTCDEGTIVEALKAYSRSQSYCWGWLGSHTYNWHYAIPLKSVSGEVTLGPSEGGRKGELYVEISSDGGSFKKIWSKSVEAGRTVKFDIPLNGENIGAIRIRVTPSPYSSGWLSVDHSSITVDTNTNTLLVEHNCHEGVHMEANEAYSRSGDYCWGWLEHQTYDIGEEKKLDYAIIYVKLGPSEAQGYSGLIEIQLSSDGQQWDTISKQNVLAGGPISVIAVKGEGRPFRYIRIAVSNETPGYYVDFTKIYLAVED